jgi:hypothetical protein
VEPYARLYRRGSYVEADYRRMLSERVRPLLRTHGLDRGVGMPRPREEEPRSAPPAEQLTLL